MTVYDRLEDARKRRQEVLAKGNGPTPRPTPSLKASAQSPPPLQIRKPPPEPNPGPSVVPVTEILSASAATLEAQTETVAPVTEPEHKRRGGGYWMGLLQAMGAIALIALLFAVLYPSDAPQQDPANAQALRTPDPVLIERDIVETQAVLAQPLMSDFTVQSVAPTPPLLPASARFDLTPTPLDSPVFGATIAGLALPSPGEPPLNVETTGPLPPPQDVPFPSQKNVPPLVLTSTPPPRQVPEPEQVAIQTPVNSGLAETTNVVLLVPAFVPQAEAERTIETAASIGIPVDQTRRANVSISRTNIRYFHAEDAEAATILAAGLGAVARDFTSFRPPPNPGVIEIWIQGRGGSTTPTPAANRGIAADLEALRDSIARALGIAARN